MHGVIVHKVGKAVRGDKVVHRHHFDALLQACAVDKATDATETVDGDAKCHGWSSCFLRNANPRIRRVGGRGYPRLECRERLE